MDAQRAYLFIAPTRIGELGCEGEVRARITTRYRRDVAERSARRPLSRELHLRVNAIIKRNSRRAYRGTNKCKWHSRAVRRVKSRLFAN